MNHKDLSSIRSTSRWMPMVHSPLAWLPQPKPSPDVGNCLQGWSTESPLTKHHGSKASLWSFSMACPPACHVSRQMSACRLGSRDSLFSLASGPTLELPLPLGFLFSSNCCRLKCYRVYSFITMCHFLLIFKNKGTFIYF